jgi:pimeloyl-ACP methyl ester carboxylesterase
MRKRWLFAIPVVLFSVYLAGPSPATPRYRQDIPAVPSDLHQLVAFIDATERAHKLKPDNEARIVWNNNSLKEKTAYSIVYLHGFSASQAEGDPVHRDIAAKFGCNLYLSRLAEHGIDTVDQLINITADKLWESAKEALAIGTRIGHKVILMGTSTGGSLALQLAAAYPQQIAAVVLLSPNIRINDPNAWLLNDPWGLQIARLVKRSDYIESSDDRPEYVRYWNTPYRLEAAVQLEELLETTMNRKTFRKVHQPLLLLYYYRDQVHQDSVVKVSAMLKMFSQLGTPDSLKREKAMPNTGNHVLGSPIKSRDVSGVEREISDFMNLVLHLQPVRRQDQTLNPFATINSPGTAYPVPSL